MKPILISSVLALFFASCSKEETAATEVPAADSTEMTASTDVKPYPLDVCIVAGEELGSMGEPITIVHEGQEIKFCCDQCQPKFEANPDEYLSKLEQ